MAPRTEFQTGVQKVGYKQGGRAKIVYKLHPKMASKYCLYKWRPQVAFKIFVKKGVEKWCLKLRPKRGGQRIAPTKDVQNWGP